MLRRLDSFAIRNTLSNFRLHSLRLTALRTYSSAPKKSSKPNGESPPKLRYIFYVSLFSFGLIGFLAPRMDKNKFKNSFTEEEFKEREEKSGLRRRSKLISQDQNQQYTFHIVPYANPKDVAKESILKSLPTETQKRFIDPQDLIKKELEEEGRYAPLLHDLMEKKKNFPRGLLTALVKQEINLFLNTSGAQYDTDLILLNYPQSTEEAIKFENDISDIEDCIVSSGDLDAELKEKMSQDDLRKLKNVVGYFDLVSKVKKLDLSR